MTDYSTARYWAINSIGFGKGFTPEQAVENFVSTQLQNFKPQTWGFKSKREFEEALRSDATVWLAPEGYTGFTSGMGTHWTGDGVPSREFASTDRVEVAA